MVELPDLPFIRAPHRVPDDLAGDAKVVDRAFHGIVDGDDGEAQYIVAVYTAESDPGAELAAHEYLTSQIGSPVGFSFYASQWAMADRFDRDANRMIADGAVRAE